MTDFFQLVSSLREQMSANLSRSDILRPLAWYIGIFTTSSVLSLFATNRPDWLLVVLIAFLGLGVVMYGLAYLFCLFNDRDALRSEKYALHKMAIEQRLFGDNLTGLIEQPNKEPAQRVELAAPSPVVIGHD